MSNYVKGIIGAILALLIAGWAWYEAHSDGDPTTTPDSAAVVNAGAGVVNAVTAPKDGQSASTTTEAK